MRGDVAAFKSANLTLNLAVAVVKKTKDASTINATVATTYNGLWKNWESRYVDIHSRTFTG